MIERLLGAGADPNTALPDGETVLMTAARTGTTDAVKALLAHGANVNAREPAKGQTALMWAAAEDNAAVVKVLAEAGGDLQARSKVGALSHLIFAVRGGHLETPAHAGRRANVNTMLPDGRVRCWWR